MHTTTQKWIYAQWNGPSETKPNPNPGLFICVCIALCIIVAHNIAQNRPDNFPSYPPDNHHCYDYVYLREGGVCDLEKPLCGNWKIFHRCTHAESDLCLLFQKWSKSVQDKWPKGPCCIDNRDRLFQPIIKFRPRSWTQTQSPIPVLTGLSIG